MNMYKSEFLAAAIIVALTAVPSLATTYRNNQQVTEMVIDNRPCLFFKVANVPEADPVVSGEGWFAIPTTIANYQTLASVVISARLSKAPLSVQTDGTTSCGFATALQVGFD